MTEKTKREVLWLRRFLGEEEEGLTGECTMPGCHNKIYEGQECFTDDSENIFCSAECVFEWYGIKKK